MGKFSQDSPEQAPWVTHLFPVKITCPDCDEDLLASDLVPLDYECPYDLSYPVEPIQGKNQIKRTFGPKDIFMLDEHAGITRDRLLATAELAKSGRLSRTYNLFTHKYNERKPQGTLVWGAGNPETAKVLLIGEAPGHQEDKTGIPFVGPAGQLLSGVLAGAEIDRENDCLIINTKLTAPFNSDGKIGKPSSYHMLANRPRIAQIISDLWDNGNGNLKLIVCLGKYSLTQLLYREELSKAVLDNKEIDMSKISMKDHLGLVKKDCLPVPVYCVYHPSYILRNMKKNVPYEDQNDVVKDYLTSFKKIKGLIDA